MAKTEEKVVSGYTKILSAPGEILLAARDDFEISLGDSAAIGDLELPHRLVIALGTIPEAAFQSYDQTHREASLRGKIIITPTTFNGAPASILLVERTGAGAWTDAEILDLCGSLETAGVILQQETPAGSVVEFYSRVEAESSSSLEAKMYAFNPNLPRAVELLMAAGAEPADETEFRSFARGWAKLMGVAFDVTWALAEHSKRFGLDTSDLNQIKNWTERARPFSYQWAEAASRKLRARDVTPSQGEPHETETDAPEPEV